MSMSGSPWPRASTQVDPESSEDEPGSAVVPASATAAATASTACCTSLNSGDGAVELEVFVTCVSNVSRRESSYARMEAFVRSGSWFKTCYRLKHVANFGLRGRNHQVINVASDSQA